GREFTSRSAVEVIKLTLNGAGVFIQFMDRPAGVFSFTASKLYIALFRRLFDDLLSLFEGRGMFAAGRIRRGGLEPITADTANLIHADRRDGFHSRIDLGRADDKAPAAADPKNTNPCPIDKWSGAP